jgi:hypothetical protein
MIFHITFLELSNYIFSFPNDNLSIFILLIHKISHSDLHMPLENLQKLSLMEIVFLQHQ